MLRRTWARTLATSSPLQERVKRVEAFEAAPQDFFVRQPFFSPAFQDPIDANAFRPLEFFVLQVGVMNHLADFPNAFVADRKTPGEGLERAILAGVRELGVEHVERNGGRSRRNPARKGEACFRVDELPDQPGGARAIDLRPWPGKPGPAPVIAGPNSRDGAFCRVGSLQSLQLRLNFLSARAVKKIDGAKLPKLPAEPAQLFGRQGRAGLA